VNRNALVLGGYARAGAGGIPAHLTRDGSPVPAGSAALLPLAFAGAAPGVSVSRAIRPDIERGAGDTA